MNTYEERLRLWKEKKDNDAILNLSGLGLEQLPHLPVEVSKLDCSKNKLKYIDNGDNEIIVSRLHFLNCSQNEIEALPDFAGDLFYLDCSLNNMTEMPYIPETIQYLDFRYNSFPNKIDAYVKYPNLIYVNGSKITESERILSIPSMEPHHTPMKIYGECSVDGKVCEVEEFVKESDQNIITYHAGKFNCCKRSKVIKGVKQMMVGRYNYYRIPCIGKWVTKNDYIQIKNTNFSFYYFRENGEMVGEEPVHMVVPYSIDDYKRLRASLMKV